MATTVYPYDGGVRVTFTVHNLADAVVDPVTFVIKYKTPSGTETTKTYGVDVVVVRDSVGVFHLDITNSAAGRWTARALATGPNLRAADEISWLVRATMFATP